MDVLTPSRRKPDVPISLHDIVHAAATGVGNRPLPVAPLSGDMRPVPVRVALYLPGAAEPFAFAPVEAFAFHPFRPAVTEGDRVVSPEQPAELVLSITLQEAARDTEPHRVATLAGEAGRVPLGEGGATGDIAREGGPPAAAEAAPEAAPAFDGSTPMTGTRAGRKPPPPPNTGAAP